MDISCAFPPVPDTADHIALAERLGYRHVGLGHARASTRRVGHAGARRRPYAPHRARPGSADSEPASRAGTAAAIATLPAGPDIPRELTAFARMAELEALR